MWAKLRRSLPARSKKTKSSTFGTMRYNSNCLHLGKLLENDVIQSRDEYNTPIKETCE